MQIEKKVVIVSKVVGARYVVTCWKALQLH